MREDMYKVIVERPRRQRSIASVDNGRIWRNSEERSGKVGIKHGYTHRKWLNENLAPLKRWLSKQIHRPWSKVYSELSQGIDRRNTVQAHIYEHIDQFVEKHTRWVDGEVCVPRQWFSQEAGWIPVREHSRITLFVHPVTGILLPNRHLEQLRRKQNEKGKLEREQRCREYRLEKEGREMQQGQELLAREEKYRPVRKKLAAQQTKGSE